MKGQGLSPKTLLWNEKCEALKEKKALLLEEHTIGFLFITSTFLQTWCQGEKGLKGPPPSFKSRTLDIKKPIEGRPGGSLKKLSLGLYKGIQGSHTLRS